MHSVKLVALALSHEILRTTRAQFFSGHIQKRNFDFFGKKMLYYAFSLVDLITLEDLKELLKSGNFKNIMNNKFDFACHFYRKIA